MQKSYLIVSICFVLICIITGCSPRIYPEKTVSDSISFIVKDTVIYRDSIVYVKIPAGISTEIVPKDSTSHIETQVAESDAWIEGGQLHHTLTNKDMMLPAPIVIPKYIHSEAYAHSQSSKILRIQKIYEEKQLSAWQSFRLTLGSIIVVFAAAYALFLIIKKAIFKK